ncbi:CYTH and CHAD domain-containing protein [Hyphococcus sp.]|uniref:CYTH and CHAD domain-containing protein n=1 Tax=Hyphococcus sp. TaxID=2038636 RepID=UPI0035C771BE
MAKDLRDRGRIEFELKFTGSPAHLAALPACDFVAAVAPQGGGWERLSSAYYDTMDGALAAHGLSLRLREEAEGLVQAVKARGPDAASRIELEISLARAADFPLATGDEDIDRLIADCGDRIRPLAKTVVDRWAAVIPFKGAEIELAVDLGSAEAVDGEGRIYSGSIAEVELELVSGEPAAVFDFARLLIANAPLRLSTTTKLEAALALLPGTDRVGKAERLDLDPEMTGGEVLAMSLSACAMRASALQSALVDYRRAEGVHQMRVVLRRLRAMERIYRRYLKSNEIADLAARAKIFATSLGPARDWDVFLGETLPPALEADYAPERFYALKAKAEAKRAEGWARATAVISSPDFTRFLIDLTAAGSLQRWRTGAKTKLERPVIEFAPRALDRALKKTFRTADEVKGVVDLAARHPLRIALKKLRYPVQLFRDLYPKDRRKPYMSALSGLQDAFGAVNDAVVAQHLADEAAAGGGETAMRAAGFISGYKAAEAREAAKKIDAAFAAFEKMTPFWRD